MVGRDEESKRELWKRHSASSSLFPPTLFASQPSASILTTKETTDISFLDMSLIRSGIQVVRTSLSFSVFTREREGEERRRRSSSLLHLQQRSSSSILVDRGAKTVFRGASGGGRSRAEFWKFRRRERKVVELEK